MRRLSAIILALAAWGMGMAPAQSVKNVRMTYGPVGATRVGATRTDDKFLPEELLLLAYDIEGLKMDPKTGVASWEGAWEILDARGKKLPKSGDIIPTQNVLLQLGG